MNRHRLPLFAVALALCGCSQVQEQFAKLLNRATPVHPNPSPMSTAMPAPAGDGKVNGYMGHYGYLVTIPASYAAAPGWADPTKTVEQVSFYPRQNPPKSADDPTIVRLEVSPLKEPDGHVTSSEELRGSMGNTFKKYGETGDFRAATAKLPGFEVIISQPSSGVTLTQVVLQGKFVLYMFSSHDQRLAESFAAALEEVAPHDRPGQ